ncbi:hypothetical protein HQ487_00960, partial [Candidatus Uhrbacteria bacterium]|nr:hypothetical protein [Candidatus Uhrbacteria bacterium]
MAQPARTTALAIPEKGSAIARIVSDCKMIIVDMLPDKIGRRRLRNTSDRLRMTEELLVMSPTSVGSPFIAQVIFRGSKIRVGSTLVEKQVNGAPQYGEDGKPLMEFAPDFDRVIVGLCELPDPNDPSKKIKVEVRPLKTCDERGNLIPYVKIDPITGEIRAGESMHCLFILDISFKTGEFTGYVYAVPLGIAKTSNITRYNDIVNRLAAGNSTLAWEEIKAIGNNIGRAVRFLTLTPKGNVATKGLTPVWKDFHFANLDPRKCDYWIVARLGGKVATLSDQSESVIIIDGKIPEQTFTMQEKWKSVELTVLGIPGEIGNLELRELDQGEVTVDWLTLFGVSLYSVNPRSGASLLRRALRNPPMDEMISLGILPPGGTREMAINTLDGFAPKIRAEIGITVTQSVSDLVHNLSPAGTDALSLPFADVLGGEPTGELLEQVLNNPTEDNLLVIGILASQTASNLGLEVWDPKCWVLR